MKPPLFSCLTSRVAKNGSLYGRFLFGPLPIDISLTVATVLRRSLLHSQATFTVVSAEIEGATHEYASLPGIQESVLEILLNLGEIVLTSTQRNFISPNFRTSISWSQESSAGFSFAFIKVSGPGVVTAKDINWPKGIFCVKPNAYIATLSSNETLTMRLKIACFLNKKKRHSLYETETKVSKSLVSETSFGLIKKNKLFPTQNSLLDIENTQDMLMRNKTNKQAFFTNNKNSFESFKLQEKAKASTITSVNAFDVKTSPSPLLNSQFVQIKKNLISSQIFSTANKISNTLLAKQTKQATLRQLANQTMSLDSYSIRKQNLTALPFSTITSKQTIFLENKTPVISVSNYDNKKDELDENSVTFRMFPGLFNDFLDLSSIKKEVSETNGQKSTKSSHVQPVELDTLSKINTIRQKNSLFNTETSTKREDFALSPQKNQQKKEKTKNNTTELAVSSSSYPVEKVNFLIERDDELAGYRHRIILEVWTNGSISPRQAIFESIGSIIKLIYNFREPLRNSFNPKLVHDSSVY